jgi:hypothetical protein
MGDRVGQEATRAAQRTSSEQAAPGSRLQRRLERTLQQVLLARAKALQDETLIDAARAALSESERDLGSDERMQRIADRLGLTREQREFV